MQFVKYEGQIGIVDDTIEELGKETMYLVKLKTVPMWYFESELEMINLFEIGQVVQDDLKNVGKVCIKWNDGDTTFLDQTSAHILK